MNEEFKDLPIVRVKPYVDEFPGRDFYLKVLDENENMIGGPTFGLLNLVTGKVESEFQTYDPDFYVEYMPEIVWELCHENAKLPAYGGDEGSDCVAGFDFYAVESFTIPPRGKVNAKTGLRGAIPPGYWVKIEARSGTSWNNCIETGAGVIDWGYGKGWGIVMYNDSDVPYHVIEGDRIAQGICMRYERVKHKVGDVDRARGGFGSSGR